MPDHDAAMLAYAKLAGLSQDRRQLGPRDKFLVLAGAAACRGGWPAVADRCRELVLAHNPAHLLKRYETFGAACEDEDFLTYLKQVERFCPYEKAEHLLDRQELTPDLPPVAAKLSAGDYALLLLGHSEKKRGE
ncbi:MAG: hypothetical protein ACT4QC_09910 [Planctomycetaceae bacterium]